MVNHYLTPGAIIDSSHTWDETQTFAAGVTTDDILNVTGDITINPANSLNVTLTANDGDAITYNDGSTDYYNLRTGTGANGTVHLFNTTTPSFASASGSNFHLMGLADFTWTMTGGTSVTTPIDGLSLQILAPIISSSSTTAITQVSSFYVAAPNVSDSDVTATRNLAAEIDGPLLLTSSIFAEGSPTEGSSGEQLESAGAGAVVIWAAAGSQAAVKDIHGYLEPQEALDAVTRVAVPRWHYRREREDGSRAATTGDYVTEYAGVLAEDFPEVMHHEGRIFSPVSAFGYAVGAIQALEARLRIVEEQSWQ